jgi:nucleoside-diphosphate-sugar epimerase
VLDQTGDEVVRAVRISTTPWEVPVGDLNESTDWSEVLGQNTDFVIHLAGQVPLIDGASSTPDDRYSQVNTWGTVNLARQCALHGVTRFVFVSTVKVLGEGKSEPYRDTDLAVPADAYAISKWEAEQALWQVAAETGMEVVVLRPPLVYGPGVKGKFLRLMQAIDKRRPLPVGAIHNQRSLIYLGNLIDAILLSLTHPKAAGKAFLVSDGDNVSTPELVRRIAAALGRRPFLLPLPVSWMRWAGRVLGKQAAVDRLLGSLCVDISPLREELGWTPAYTMQEGLEVTAQWYRRTKAVV